MKKLRIKERVFAMLLALSLAFTMMPAIANAAVPTDVDEVIQYQIRDDKDVRLVSYVDALELYSSVSFTLTIDGKTSKELVCTTGYNGLYANGELKTTEDIYGVEGYFVTYTINGYLNVYAGKEVTITVKYTTVEGDVSTTSRTVTIGSVEVELEPVTVTGNLTYANLYDWSTDDDGNYIGYQNQIFVYASSDETDTPYSINEQTLFSWFYGFVFEYDETNEVWVITSADTTMDGTCDAETETLGDNKFVVLYHSGAATGQADAYSFFSTYAKVGAEFTLNTDLSTLQSASGALTDVTLSYTYYVEVEKDNTDEDNSSDDGSTDDGSGDGGSDEGSSDSGSDDSSDNGNTGSSDVVAGQITSINYYQWVASNPQQDFVYGYATASTTQTPLETFHASYNLFANGYGIVLEEDSSTGKFKVIVSDLDTTDGTNAAESQILSDGILVVLFGEDASVGQPEAYEFFTTYATLGAEFYLSTELEYIQYSKGATGSVSNLYLSLEPMEISDGDTTEEPEDPVVGTISSTVKTYYSTGTCTKSSGDTDGLSAVLYASSSSTIGVSTKLNLGAVNTELYTSDEAAAKQLLGVGTPSDTDIDNAYLYLCFNGSSYWGGDFGLIKRFGDADWEIVTSEYKGSYSTTRWNAYSYSSTSGVTVSCDEDYVYWKYNVMDGGESLYIKDSESVGNLKMVLQASTSSGSGTLTFSIYIDENLVFSVADTGTLTSLTFGRAASITNSSTTSYGSTNYIKNIASTYNGKTPAELSNVQFYDSYYYTSSGYGTLTLSTGSLWLYPNSSSNGGYTKTADGDPIVTFQEVLLSDGVYMDIIDIYNY